MFARTYNLSSLDFRNATFDSVTSYASMFNATKSGISIITKNTTTRAWLQARFTEENLSGSITIAS